MLFRKIESIIEEHLKSSSNKILLIDGARQIGKTYIIRHVGKKLFPNFIEINMIEDSLQDRFFADTMSVNDFYFQLSSIAGNKMKEKNNTLIFIDEIQAYPYLLSLLKFLAQDQRYTFICSGSLLGVTLANTPSIPMGSIRKVRMFPLDFEEFLYANGFNEYTINTLREKYINRESLNDAMHRKMLDLFKKYLIVGGLPDAVNAYIDENNVQLVREIQKETREYYAIDASKYDLERKLHIRRIYEMIPSNMENKKKRVFIKDIENKKWKTSSDYAEEFEYLVHSGIATRVQAISNPTYPLIESSSKNLLKLYMNDSGILTSILYKNNIRPILDDNKSINLGSVYETVIANELMAHGHSLFYYDNRNKGEVDFLIDDDENLSIIPLEIKSGKDYQIHSALSNMMKTNDYGIHNAFVLSNAREIEIKNNITYLPIYFILFI